MPRPRASTNDRGNILESDETNNNRVDAAVVTRVASDLQVTNVTAQGPTYSGESTRVTWTVQNMGAAVWDGTRFWYDAIWISKDPTFNRSAPCAWA